MIVVGFISIAFVVVKVKFFKCLWTHHPWNPFWVFWALSPTVWSNFPEIFTKNSISRQKHSLNNFSTILIFKDVGRTQCLVIWPNFDPPVSPKYHGNWGKLKTKGKNSAIRLSKYVKVKTPSPLPFYWKTGLLLALKALFFTKSRVWLKVKGS